MCVTFLKIPVAFIKSPQRRICLCLGFLVLSVGPSGAALIDFNFTGTNPGQNSPWNTGTTIDPNASTTGFNLGSVVGVEGNDRFNARAWSSGSTLATAISGNDYFGFVLTINSGYAADLNGATVNLILQRSASPGGPMNYALMSSVGGFTAGSEIQSGTVSGTQTYNITLGSSGYDNLTGNLEFRIYGWNAANGNGEMSANDFILGGTISAVPEPANVALGIFGGIGGIAGLVHWRRNKKAETLRF